MQIAETAGGTLIQVSSINPKSAADQAGLRVGDIIFQVNGQQNNTMHQLLAQTGGRQQSFQLGCRRRIVPGGQKMADQPKYKTIEMDLPRRPADNPGKPQIRLFSYDYGGVIKSMGPDAAFFQQLGLKAGDTVVEANGMWGFTPLCQLFAQ